MKRKCYTHKKFKTKIKSRIGIGKWKNLHKVTKFSQVACLKPYIDINTELSKKAKYGFENNFFKVMNNNIFQKPWKILEKIGISNL